MSLIELDISIWGQPHRLSQGWCHVVQIGDYFDGGLPGGFFQSLRFAKRDRGMPEVDYDQPHEKFSVSPEAFAALARELDSISYFVQRTPLRADARGRILRPCAVSWTPRLRAQLARALSRPG